MKKVPLYSRSNASRQGSRADGAAAPASTKTAAPLPPAAPPRAHVAQTVAAAPAIAPPALPWRRKVLSRLQSDLPSLVAALAVAALIVSVDGQRGQAPSLTQKAIDAAVLHTLETKTLPSQSARAAAAVRPSVVLVRGTHQLSAKDAASEGVDASEVERSVGTGVVIVDSGVILTNLHVVSGSDQLSVVFADGTESKATVVSTQPDNDLAVLQAMTLPDDLQAATLRSTKDLMPGDEVVAVGFPFGIGPSVSAGVVSGLKRGHRTPDGKRALTNLIQFDAAANPGNSGGPLVTMDGEVVGIVTAILNPTEARTFIGIGFAVPIENAASGAGLAPF